MAIDSYTVNLDIGPPEQQHAWAMAEGARCGECPLKNMARGPVPPSLPQNLDVLVVAEAPGHAEIDRGETLVGASGKEIRTALRNAGADPSRTGFTNAACCAPLDEMKKHIQDCKRKKIPNAIECCRPRLMNELSRARFAILMGGASLTGVGVRGSILKLRGTPVQIPDGPRAVPIPHAAFVMRDEGRIMRPIFHADVNKAVRISRGGDTWREPPYFVPRTAAEIDNFLAAQGPRVAVDVETDGVDAWTCRLRRIGIGTADGVMIYSPLSVHGHQMLPQHEVQAQSRAISNYFQRAPRLDTHNGIAYDSIVLWRHQMPLPDERTWDGLVGHQIGPTSELPHALDFVASVYTDAPRWKDDVKHSEVRDDAVLDKYLSYDIATTWLSAPYIEQNLVNYNQTQIYALDAELFRIGRSMSMLGLYVDQQLRWKFAAEYQTKANALRKEFCDIAGRDVNPNSPKQVQQLLYHDLGLPASEEHMTDSGDPSTDENTLLDLLSLGLDARAVQVIHALLGCREAEKILGTYTGHIVDGFLEGGPTIHADGCVRPTWRPGKRSGRWGSNDPNAQNLPKKLRAMYVAKPGNVLVAADMQAVELRMIAMLAGDDPLIAAFKAFDEGTGPDVHIFNACTVFKCTPEAVTDEIRTFIKRFVYALNYDAEPPKVYQTLSLLRDDNLKPMFPHITLAEIQRLHALWARLHPAIVEWKKKLIYGWRSRGYIGTRLGDRRRYFIGGEKPTEMPNHDVQGCHPPETRVLTRNGYVPIGIAPPTGEVWTGTRWAPYRVLDRGPAERAELRLANGQTVQCDTRHQVLMQTEDRYEFRHYRDLQPGDRICLSIAHPLQFGAAGSPDEFYWIGFSIGNGSTWRNHLSVTFGDRKGRYLKENAAQRFDDYVVSCGYTPQKRFVREGKITCAVEHKAWRARWESLGYDWRWRSHTKRIPKAVWTASLECRRQFVLGVLDADGTIGTGGSPALHLCQAPLLAELQQLFRTCGVESTLRGPYRPDRKRKKSRSWRLDLSGLQLLRHFEYGLPRKSSVVVRWMPAPACAVAAIVKIQTPRGKLTESQQTLKARARDGGRTNIYTLIDLYRALGAPVPECYASYELVAKRSLGRRERTYTLSVDDTGHRFDAEGVISKNSSASMQNDSIKALAARYPFDFANHRGLLVNGHDQLVVECAESEAKSVEKIVEDVMQRRIDNVLFPAKAKSAKDWKSVS